MVAAAFARTEHLQLVYVGEAAQWLGGDQGRGHLDLALLSLPEILKPIAARGSHAAGLLG